MPAVKGNINALTTGSERPYRTLMLGTWPKGAAWIRRSIGRLRNELCEAVLERRGKLTLTDSATCQSIVRHESVCLMAQRWLRMYAGELTATERLRHLEMVCKATELRDKGLRRLDLDGEPSGSRLLDEIFESHYANVTDALDAISTAAQSDLKPKANGQPAPDVLDATSTAPEAAS